MACQVCDLAALHRHELRIQQWKLRLNGGSMFRKLVGRRRMTVLHDHVYGRLRVKLFEVWRNLCCHQRLGIGASSVRSALLRLALRVRLLGGSGPSLRNSLCFQRGWGCSGRHCQAIATAHSGSADLGGPLGGFSGGGLVLRDLGAVLRSGRLRRTQLRYSLWRLGGVVESWQVAGESPHGRQDRECDQCAPRSSLKQSPAVLSLIAAVHSEVSWPSL